VDRGLEEESPEVVVDTQFTLADREQVKDARGST
jgi:hypothetical protein